MNVELRVKLGPDGQTGLVTCLKIPDFKDPPVVVVWGDRIFLRALTGENVDCSWYLEVFAYHAPLLPLDELTAETERLGLYKKSLKNSGL